MSTNLPALWSRRIVFLLLLIGPAAQRVSGQISPGELSNAHASLDGLEHCTSCHTMGKTISNEKCLGCHGEIAARLQGARGLHGTFGGRECVECHKEHHGRSFSIIRFEPKELRHELLGYPLQGGHARLHCRDCHKPGLIRAADIAGRSAERRERTYLGLTRDCTGCHADPHHGLLGPACTSCHTQERWKPAGLFSHDRTRFRLTGRHGEVACIKCHRSSPGTPAVLLFTGLSFSSCLSCHTDPHAGKFGQSCDRCHSTAGWVQGATRNFNHASVRFPLRGKHAGVRCEQCHNAQAPGASAGPAPTGKTRFKVAHFERCTDCHADAHQGQFSDRPDRGACESCHSVEGFTPSSYSLESHKEFPLRGPHRSLACIRCHPSSPLGGSAKLVFRLPGPWPCTRCHDDVHAGQFAARMVNGCETCHTVDAWLPARFSHETTRFPLDGKHRGLACISCHKPEEREGRTFTRYTGLPVSCSGCHAEKAKVGMQ